MRRRICVVTTLLALFALCVPDVARAQAPAPARPVTIRGIKSGMVPTPQYQLRKGQTSDRVRQWFQILVQYDTEPEWLDELTLIYYVLMRPRGVPQKPPVLFRGEVTYVTIEKGRHFSDVYLHPSTLARYGDVEAVAVLANIRGQLVSMQSQPQTQQRWWEQLAPVDGFVLNRMHTPFAMLDFDVYEALKPPAAR